VRSLTDEAKLFGRMSAFGLLVGTAYWFLTYERAGTVLLLAFGGATGLAALAILVGARRGRSAADAGTTPRGDVEALPGPGWAPLGVATGLGSVALGAAFGPWLTIAGVLVAIIGGLSWLSATMRETDASRGRPPRD
jgi:hypothetical protein